MPVARHREINAVRADMTEDARDYPRCSATFHTKKVSFLEKEAEMLAEMLPMSRL
jgi:hypothetical protein